MDKPHLVTAPLADATLVDLDRLAAHFGCTREHLVTTAVMRFVDEESRIFPGEFDDRPPYVSDDPLEQVLRAAEEKAIEAMDAFLKESIEQADRGELISQEDMEAWFAARGVRDAAE